MLDQNHHVLGRVEGYTQLKFAMCARAGGVALHTQLINAPSAASRTQILRCADVTDDPRSKHLNVYVVITQPCE